MDRTRLIRPHIHDILHICDRHPPVQACTVHDLDRLLINQAEPDVGIIVVIEHAVRVFQGLTPASQFVKETPKDDMGPQITLEIIINIDNPRTDLCIRNTPDLNSFV